AKAAERYGRTAEHPAGDTGLDHAFATCDHDDRIGVVAYDLQHRYVPIVVAMPAWGDVRLPRVALRGAFLEVDLHLRRLCTAPEPIYAKRVDAALVIAPDDQRMRGGPEPLAELASGGAQLLLLLFFFQSAQRSGHENLHWDLPRQAI